MKTIIFLFLSLLLVTLQASNANTSPTMDSLHQIASKQVGAEKLRTLAEIVEQTVSTPQLPEAVAELEKEARAQKSDDYQAKAYYCRLHHGVFETQLPYDKLVHYAEEAIKAYKKTKSIDGRSRVEGLLLNYLMNEAKYELALYRTRAFLQTADNEIEKAVSFMLLGYIYLDIEQGREAIEMAGQGISVCQRNANNPLFVIINHSLYGILSKGYSLIGDYNSALTAVETYITKTIIPYNIYLNKQEKMFEANRRKMHILLQLKQYNKAGKLLECIKAYGIHTDSKEFSAKLEAGYAAYYLCTQQYDKALESSNKTISYFTKERNRANYLSVLRRRAKIFDGLGNYKQASKLKEELVNLSDSTHKALATSRLEQIQTIYQVERLKAEKEQDVLKLQRTYMVGTAFGVICLLAIAILLITRKNVKIQTEKNKKLFEQYKQLTEHTPQLSDTANDRGASHECIAKRILYNKIVSYLIASKSYTSTDLTREKLALEVATNRQYLIEAIHENTAMTYGEFITDFRLQHAQAMLLQNGNLTIEKIYQLSGFNNNKTFYKYFRQKFGMTPVEFKFFANEEGKKQEWA